MAVVAWHTWVEVNCAKWFHGAVLKVMFAFSYE